MVGVVVVVGVVRDTVKGTLVEDEEYLEGEVDEVKAAEAIVSTDARSSKPNNATPGTAVAAALDARVAFIDGKAHPSAFCSDMLLLPPKLT